MNQTRLPKYIQIANELKNQIEQGELKPGSQMPSYAEMTSRYGISQHTVEKVHIWLEQQGLVKREQGRGVFVAQANRAEKSTGFIGYVDHYFHYTRNTLYYNSILMGVREQARQSGLQVVLIDDVSAFSGWDYLSGLVLCEAGHYIDFEIDRVRRIIPARLPCVNTMIPFPGASSILTDDADGIRQIVRHLAELGHRRVAYLSRVGQPFPLQHPLIRLRYNAYLQALLENRMEYQPEMVFSLPIDFELEQEEFGYQGMRQWLEAGWHDLNCTAVMAQNDRVAIGAMRALEEAGLEVPHDVGIVGFDNTDIFRTAPYRLTSVQVPLHEVGAAAVCELAGLIKDPAQMARETVLPVQLIEGKTTCAIGKKNAASEAA